MSVRGSDLGIRSDIINPQFWGNKTFDLVVSGPNEGSNTGEYLYTLSGTMGATYASVERGVSRHEASSICVMS